MEKTIPDLEALAREAHDFIHTLQPQEESATLVTLSGELGAGKTAFTQAVARVLGIDEAITSPTFVLEKIYRLPAGAPFAALVHIDAYRLSSGADLKALGFDELMHEPGNLVLIEWPERVADALPTPQVRISITPNADGTRTFLYG